MAKANNVSDTPKKRGRPPKQKTTVEYNGQDLTPEPEIITEAPDRPETQVIVRDPAPEPIQEDSGREAALSIVGGVTTPELEQALKVQTEQRQLIQKFIQDNLVVDVDYGKIHVVKSCAQESAQRGSCTKDYHFSKSILFKPGQEKIFSLFGITDELVKDEDAYEMLPGVKDLVAYKCVMYRGKNRVGEGRGAATLSGTQGDPNSTIKKAEKRARMDACLSLGFSAYFTQDLDDPEYASQREMMNSKAAAEAERRDRDEFGLMPRDPELPIDNSERQVLGKIIIKMGFTDPDEITELLKANGVSDPQNMKSGEARQMMSKLSNNMFSPPANPKPKAPADTVIEDIGDEPITADDIPDLPNDPPQAAVAEPELVVDDDLKNEVMNRANMIGLNSRGGMWLMQKIAGKPFAKWEKLTDHEWRRAYEIVQGVLDGVIDVDDSHLGPTTKTPAEAREVPENVDPETGEVLDQTDNVKNVQELFPGAEELK